MKQIDKNITFMEGPTFEKKLRMQMIRKKDAQTGS